MRLLILSLLISVMAGCASSRPQPLTVPPVQTLAPAILGQPYQNQITASGGIKPYSFRVISGAMPDGLVMDPTTGQITGVPTLRGSFSFQVQVSDSK